MAQNTITLSNPLKLVDLQTEHNRLILEYGEMLENDATISDLTAKEDEINKVETKYAKEKKSQIYESAFAQDDPFVAILTLYEWGVIAHKKETDSGVFLGFTSTAKLVTVDMVDFIKASHDTKRARWFNLVERFNQLMTAKASIDLGYSIEAARRVYNSFYMKKLTESVKGFADLDPKAKSRVKDPLSKTTLTAELQTVIDGILFKDDGTGKNIFRVRPKDMAYILATYTKRGKAAGRVVSSKSKTLATLIADTCHMMITSRAYVLEFKPKNGVALDDVAEKKDDAATSETEPKSKTAAKSKPAPTKVPAPKAKDGPKQEENPETESAK